MANKLKNLLVDSVDLVDRGANPDADIRLFKRKAPETDESIITKFLAWLKKSRNAGEIPTDSVGKDVTSFTESFSREQMRAVSNEMFDCCYALSDSLSSIVCDNTLNKDAKKALMIQSLDEFADTVRTAAESWADGNRLQLSDDMNATVQKSEMQEQAFEKLWSQYENSKGQQVMPMYEMEETETMKIDKSKMTPEEKAALEALEKKYGTEDDTQTDSGTEEQTQDGNVAKSKESRPTEAELHPDVKKALADYQAMMKQQAAEVEELKKSLEIERLTAVAKKYEVLGKRADETAAKLYELKKAGGTVYDDYVALLDENVTMLEKSGMFSEIGKNTQGSAGTVQTLGIKAAEITKAAANSITSTDAIVKAFEDNPELAAKYEAEYRGGM